MPGNNYKRKFEDFDPTASDPDDDDYDANADRTVRTSKPSKSQPKKRSKRTRHGGYDTDGSELGSEEDDFAEESFEDEDEPPAPVEIGRSGRPVRKSAKATKNYEESDPDDDAALQLESERDEEEEKAKSKRPNRSKMVKLKLNTPKQTPGPVGRTSRAGSTARSKRGYSAEPTSAGTRRSSRLHHDDNEPIIALTGSGRHAEIIRPATRSPESKLPSRAARGGKGLKGANPPSLIIEDEHENSSVPKDEAEEEHTTVARAGRRSARSRATVGDEDDDDVELPQKSDTQLATQGDDDVDEDVQMVQESPVGVPEPREEAPATVEGDGDDDEDEEPIFKRGRTRGSRVSPETFTEPVTISAGDALASNEEVLVNNTSEQQEPRTSKSQRSKSEQNKKKKNGGNEDDSDFEIPDEDGDEDMSSDSAVSNESPQKGSAGNDEEDYESSNTRRSGRLAKGASRRDDSAVPEEEELAEELEELKGDGPKRVSRAKEIIYEDSRPSLRRRKRDVDYRIVKPDANLFIDLIEEAPSASPSRRSRATGGGVWQRNLFSTYGPFGGAGGPPPVFGRGMGATGGVDSDSSDDERMQRPTGFGGAVGMTPTTAAPPGLLAAGQTHNVDPIQGGLSGTPANLGKIKNRQALADADPLGVDQNVSFDKVGGLEDHINQLKEMVTLPLLYPEIFQRFKVTPPRGVLFHGPPGTGKTLLARALAASCSSEGRKITFYMRKGADALSKWVGEAERQLRLLFDEARNNQPSIIFFDEIDGLAPVRSSKQEQIHASIVSTLLALMDGMDGRGQVIVIGATNRPDSIDPALRRPGRFDREFYFPLPNLEARRAIIDIHTSGWEPGLSPEFKSELATLTKGYGGADLRAMCTEAALNAVQRRYPQIYKSNEKLLIDPTSIEITAKDFMISVKKMIPSSERSASSGAAALALHIEPLLRTPLAEIKSMLDEILPKVKKVTALEEAQFEDYKDADGGFGRERTQREFETSRVFRPRLLIRGLPGMGQQYIAGALLHHFEGLHVQSFDLPTLMSDSTRSPEAAVVQLFTEVKRHKPSVIYVPNVDSWYRTLGSTVISTFLGLLRSIPATDPVLLLGVLESEPEIVDKGMLRDLFGFSKKNQFQLDRPHKEARREFFNNIAAYIRKPPSEFPHPENRQKRKLEVLPIAPPPPPKVPTKEELKAQKQKDMLVLNYLKIKIQPIMDQIKLKYKKFRNGVLDRDQIGYLFLEADPDIVPPDLPQANRRFEKALDKHGYDGILEKDTGKFYYNRDIQMIEERLSNGYYHRPKDFLTDIRFLLKDARTIGDKDRQLKASEMLANVEVDIAAIEMDAGLADCENVYLRFKKREEERVAAATEKRRRELQGPGTTVTAPGDTAPQPAPVAVPYTGVTSGAVPSPTMMGGLGIPPQAPVTPVRQSHSSSLSNGFVSVPAPQNTQLPQSNGSSVPSGAQGDVEMIDSDADPSQLMSQQSAHYQGGQFSQQSPLSRAHWGAQRERSGLSSWEMNASRTTSQLRSQISAVTAMPPGSQIEDFNNEASTTTSGQKSSDKSNRSSQPFNTQSSNGIVAHAQSRGNIPEPDFSAHAEKSHGDSQLPNTQELEVAISEGSVQNSSQPHSSQSQPPVPPFNAPSKPAAVPNSIRSILNDPQPALILDNTYVNNLHDQFAERTSGCTVEQLEQINAALMDEIWKTRDNWNRNAVGEKAQKVFNEVIDDVEDMQNILPASLGTA